MALVAAAAVILGAGGVPSAKAADLGGDCCADLEERVAELEATTARKGNRRMSLTVTGQVHRIILWWDDKYQSNTYYGLDSTNSSSRFVFLGSARVNPKVQMGFEIMIEIEAGATSSKVSQLDEDGKIATGAPLGNSVSFNQSNVDAYMGDARRVAWWIEHADIGRLTVGRFESAGVVTTIDLSGGNIFLPASSSFILLNGSFFLRGSLGEWYNLTWGNIGDPAAAQGRTELVRYDSPTWHGFIYSASLAEAGDYWGHMLRYANEFKLGGAGTLRVAAGIGYERARDRATPVLLDPTQAAVTGIAPDTQAWGGSLALRHVQSGLFIQGHYQAADYNQPNHVANGYWGSAGGASKKNWNHWLIQGGIGNNWFGIGQTTLYGEYGESSDFGAESNGRTFAGTVNCTSPPFAAIPCFSNFSTVFGVTDTELTIWGLGITQNIDAAATTLFLGYRNFEADITCRTTGPNCTGATNLGAAPQTLTTEPMHVIVTGARVLF